MDLNTVIQNLNNTISGKRKLQASLRLAISSPNISTTEHMVASATEKFLRINIDELELIKSDLENIE